MGILNSTNQELVDQLVEAQEMILQGIEMLREVARQDKESRGWAEAYIISNLTCVATGEHGYMDSSQNIDMWIKRLEKRAFEESEEGEEE